MRKYGILISNAPCWGEPQAPDPHGKRLVLSGIVLRCRGPRQGWAANTAAHEPTRVRTGRALTGAAQRK